MIATRKIVQIPASSSRRLSMMATNLEFPHSHTTPKAPTAAKFNNLTSGNGARVASRETDSGVVSFKVAVLGGSGSESAAQFGSAQLLSSGAFSDANGLSAIRALENLGARINTSCDREKITFDVTVMANHAADALTEVLKVVGTSVTDVHIPSEMKEQASVHYKLHAEDAQAQLRELLHQAAYGETSAWGHSVFAQNLQKVDAAQALSYRATHFLRENLVVASNGGISAAQVRDVVDKATAGMQSKSSTPLALTATPFVGGDSRMRVELSGDRTTVGVAFPVPAGEASKAYTVLAGVLNARGVSACAATYAQGGLLSVHIDGSAAASAEKLQKVVAELKSVAGGNTAELAAVKQKLSVQRLLSLEGTGATCYLVKSVLTGVAPAKLADVRDVTPAQVSAAAQTLLKQTPAVAVYGATAGVPSFAAVQKLLV